MPTTRTLLVVLSLLSGGCTTVAIHSNGAVRTESRFGVLRLHLDPAHTAAVAVSSVGIVTLPSGISLGYTRWQGVGLPTNGDGHCVVIQFDPAPPTGDEK